MVLSVHMILTGMGEYLEVPETDRQVLRYDI